MKRVAIIDIGSKSIKFFVGEKQNDGTIATILDTNNIPSWQADISINVPVLVTDSVINVTQTTAQVIYTVSDDGGSAFVFSGVCWDTAHNPTVLNNHIVYSFCFSCLGFNI